MVNVDIILKLPSEDASCQKDKYLVPSYINVTGWPNTIRTPANKNTVMHAIEEEILDFIRNNISNNTKDRIFRDTKVIPIIIHGHKILCHKIARLYN